MTEEQIKQNAEKCADGFIADAIFKRYLRDTYIAGAHSRDEEIKDLSIATTWLVKENKELKIKLAELRNPWISVEDRLPEENKDNSGYSVKVIGMFASGSISDCFCSLEEDIWFTGIFTCDKPIYWMPIPELKKGE